VETGLVRVRGHAGAMTDDLYPVAELDAPTPSSDRRLPMLWVVVGLLLAAGVLAAFLVGDERTASERVAAAAGAVEEDDHAFEVTMEFAGAPLPGGFTLSGAVDVDTSRARATGTLGLGAGEGQAVPPIDVLVDGRIQYLKLPPELGGDRPWIRFDAGAFGGSSPAPGAATNPLDALRQLDAVIGDVERVGEEKVRGEPTVRFRFVVDALKADPDAAAKLPEEVRAGLRRVPTELWLDSRDRPRRLRQSVDLGPSAGGKVTTTIELFDFGAPVTIDLPPEDQVRDADLTDPAGLGSLFGPAPVPAD
jgi:hypothetical protein